MALSYFYKHSRVKMTAGLNLRLLEALSENTKHIFMHAARTTAVQTPVQDYVSKLLPNYVKNFLGVKGHRNMHSCSCSVFSEQISIQLGLFCH